MAEPIPFSGQNQIFKPAPGTEHIVRDLPCYYDRATGELITCYRLSDLELAQVRETGLVWCSDKVGYPATVFPRALSGLPLMEARNPDSDPDDIDVDRYNSSGQLAIARLTNEELIYEATGAPWEAWKHTGLTHLTLVDIHERLAHPGRFQKPDLTSAKVLAVTKHRVQEYAGRAYTFHLAEVERIVAAAGLDNAHRCAAWLHDVVEDTEVNIGEVKERFGTAVADIVWACSGFGVNRKARNADYYAKLAEYPLAWPVKAADRICHLETAVADEDRSYAGMYVKEAEEFEARALPHLMPYLAGRLKRAHADARLLMEGS